MTRVLVNIHGAGKTMSDFYKEALAALAQLLGQEPPCLPCWYGDLANVGSRVLGNDEPLEPGAQEFREQLERELARTLAERAEQERAARRARGEPTFGTLGLVDLGEMGADVVADVVRYLFDSGLRGQVQSRLRASLEQAAVEYDETILVSHSLGTVVAFDVLHDAGQQFRVSRWVTMGSPLKKLVTLGRRSGEVGQITAETVPFWRNVYDTHDLVADAIGPSFPAFLIEDVYVHVGDTPLAAHDYWRNPQVLGMIASWFRG